VPGMFASVAIDAGAATSEITLPQTAITYNPYGNTVFVVEHGTSGGKPRDTVQQRFVKLGDTRGDQVAVLSGIAPGDVVVSAGQMKLRNGTAIAINNAVQPTDQPKPTPPNE
jgi:membrane fusion protein, multidrug efflux system